MAGIKSTPTKMEGDKDQVFHQYEVDFLKSTPPPHKVFGTGRNIVCSHIKRQEKISA